MTKLATQQDIHNLIKTPQELIHIKHKITLRQYKYWLLMLRAYREAFERHEIADSHGFFRIRVSTLEEWLGYDLARAELKSDLEAVRREPIIYNTLGKNGKQTLRGSGFISEWEIQENVIGFRLPRFLEESIEQLDLKSSIFQKINWHIFHSFAGKYEAILYKLCRDYMGSRRTPVMTIHDYREYMGLSEHEYAEYKDLNKYIISAPVKKINESSASDITIEVVVTRAARRVVSVQFIVSPKHQAMLDFGDDPAFRFCRITMPLQQQKAYLAHKAPSLIEFSIQRANDYADAQQKAGKPVTNLGALYRKSIQEDWGAEYQSKKLLETEQAAAEQAKKTAEATDAKSARLKEMQQDYLLAKTLEAIKGLSLDEKHTYVKSYIEHAGPSKAKSYDPDKVEFTDSLEKLQFSTWLKKTIAPSFDASDFAAWAQAKKM